MTTEDPKPTTEKLLAELATTRVRVAADVERLAAQLAPEQLKDRALDVAQHSMQSLAARALHGVPRSPRELVSYFRKHPVAGAAIFTGAALLVWRIGFARTRRY